jgi:purine nucleoside phosphorylase
MEQTEQGRYGFYDALDAAGLIDNRLYRHGLDSRNVQDGVVLGSGLGGFAEDHIDQDRVRITFNEIFQALGLPLVEGEVQGHDRSLIIGPLKGTSANRLVIAQAGREHPYEDVDTKRATFWIRVMQILKTQNLLISNAGGIITPKTLSTIPALMLVKAHLDFGYDGPLVGRNDPRLGLRFPHGDDMFPRKTRKTVLEVAKEHGIPLIEGTHIREKGPGYEDPVLIYLYRAWLKGVYTEAWEQPGEEDFVKDEPIVGIAGMSSTFEVLAAQHAALAQEETEVDDKETGRKKIIKGYPAFLRNRAQISVATNCAAGLGLTGKVGPPDHDEVKKNADLVREQFGALARSVILRWREEEIGDRTA